MGSEAVGKLLYLFIMDVLVGFLEIWLCKGFLGLNPFLASILKLKHNYIPILQYKKHQIPRKNYCPISGIVKHLHYV